MEVGGGGGDLRDARLFLYMEGGNLFFSPMANFFFSR